jgi:hypothetical protein
MNQPQSHGLRPLDQRGIHAVKVNPRCVSVHFVASPQAFNDIANEEKTCCQIWQLPDLACLFADELTVETLVAVWLFVRLWPPS